MKGKFISFEGIDGAGKSTHVAWCTEFLQKQGVPIRQVREPGGTALGEVLREQLLHHSMHALTETLLMFASRHELVKEIIEPELEKGTWVISDRFVDASYAYQGGGRLITREVLDWLTAQCVGESMPDYTFWFSAPLEIAHDRRTNTRKNEGGAEADRFEQENQDFFQRVHNGYQQCWKHEPERIVRVDSTQSIEAIREELAEKLLNLLDR